MHAVVVLDIFGMGRMSVVAFKRTDDWSSKENAFLFPPLYKEPCYYVLLPLSLEHRKVTTINVDW